MTTTYVNNALISVFDKTNISKFAYGLIKNNIKIFSTKNTAIELKNNNIKTYDISEITQFPEIMDGKIKTIHPKIFGGILGDIKKDQESIQKYNITLIDLIIINFYPIRYDEYLHLSHNIDIGGPAMVRAAVKNYKNIVIIVDYDDYDDILNEINTYGFVSKKKKLNLAIKALEYTTQYDISIIEYLNQKKYYKNKKKHTLPNKLFLTYKKIQNLKYGENPKQKSSLYISTQTCNKRDDCFESMKQLNGTKLSYNNIYDANIAYECVNQFIKPTCVIIKHGNPCAVSNEKNILHAYLSAYQSDPISSFGGIIGFNQIIDETTILNILKNQFVEMIIGPDITDAALSIVKSHKKIKILIFGKYNPYNLNKTEFKSINNSLLLQQINTQNQDIYNWSIVSKRQPKQIEKQYAIFAWNVVKFVKSNAVVYSHKFQTISISAGQTNRVECIKIANRKYFNNQHRLNLKNKKLVIASDAFFPFRDSIDELSYTNNISCIIQPGGSIKDAEIIQAANDYNMCMIFTHQRVFKH